MARVPSAFTVKAWCGGLGLAAGLAGMAFERRWLVWLAVSLLGAALLLRFAHRSDRAP